MHIWTLDNWEKIYGDLCIKKGIRLHFEKGIDCEVKRAILEFINWLRTEYYFPVRVNIYFKCAFRIKALDGELVSATFFGPFDKMVNPYIRIATGDYQELLKNKGKDNALGAYLYTIAHELTHYFQWINDLKLTEKGEERQATVYSNYILDEYKEIREHP